MGFTLDNVVPWSRSFAEYVAMFALSPEDLEKSILGCSDGPVSFNHTLTRLRGCVTSVDPLYAFDVGQLERRIDETSPLVVAQTYQNVHGFVWRSFTSVEQLTDTRLQAMKLFLTDYEAGRAEGRYLEGSLPTLTFKDDTFELVLCLHYFSTANTFLRTFMSKLPKNSYGWPARCAFSRCSSWVWGRRATLIPS